MITNSVSVWTFFAISSGKLDMYGNKMGYKDTKILFWDNDTFGSYTRLQNV